ncbi:beta-lactamase regulator AmpE [Thalassomonas actiniarum]|uniref:Beta-lactamase regulator AmpE n=1 Tax=Thalassomonas actiniarum TaxID=485447 RepID=A0AAE9YS12_9GAMM|nr:beta-lactamase regulator AmpE [Thalassomonas actiniarum]WDD98432.1 beta-lactamase regulator AmpE [Thalassomonas actiniarum]
MSLISLLIALAAERYLSSSLWQFNSYYQRYTQFIRRTRMLESGLLSALGTLGLIFLPVAAVYGLLWLIDDSLLHLIFSTVILIICFGCIKTRSSYKRYLMAAYRGEQSSCELMHAQLRSDKNLPEMGFGQTLVWLNYRYYIAIMLFFIFLGAPGVVFYRLVATLAENPGDDQGKVEADDDMSEEQQAAQPENLEANLEKRVEERAVEGAEAEQDKAGIELEQGVINNAVSPCQQFLFWLDWIPVRLTSFGYMLVGHFSKALPVWLESLFDFSKQPSAILADVAQKSEDLMVDSEDCTAEPCLLVRLAKRNLLLLLAIISLLTLSGVIS